MADRLVVMSNGARAADRHAARPLRAPGRRFVAGFVGRSDLPRRPGRRAGRSSRPRAGCDRLPRRRRPGRRRWRCGPSAYRSPRAAGRHATTAFPARSNSSPISAACSNACAPVARGPRSWCRSPNRGATPRRGRRRSDVGWPAQMPASCFAGRWRADVTRRTQRRKRCTWTTASIITRRHVAEGRWRARRRIGACRLAPGVRAGEAAASSSAPGAATTRACSPRTSRTRC